MALANWLLEKVPPIQQVPNPREVTIRIRLSKA
jgi:hypothetical protein